MYFAQKDKIKAPFKKAQEKKYPAVPHIAPSIAQETFTEPKLFTA